MKNYRYSFPEENNKSMTWASFIARFIFIIALLATICLCVSRVNNAIENYNNTQKITSK